MELQIKQFNGMSTNEAMWEQGFSRYCYGVDIWGLEDNQRKVSKPGVLQAMKIMTVESEAASPNDVTDLIQHMAYYPTSGTVWGCSATSSPRLYERSGTTWTLRRSTSGGDLATATTSGNIAAFGGSLWTAQNIRISRWDNTTWTQSFAVLSNASEHPMKVFAGKLYILDGRYVATIDSTPTFTAQALTLPADFTGRTIEVFGDRLYIFADNGSYSRMFIWDGISTLYQSYFNLEHSTAPYICFSDGVLWIIPPINNSASTPIYTFNGSSFVKRMDAPQLSVQTNRDAVVPYRSGIVIASSDTSGGVNRFEDGVSGLWILTRADQGIALPSDYQAMGVPYQFGLAFNPAGGVTTTDIGGIYASQNQIFVGTNNSSNFEVWEVGGSDSATNTSGVWQSLPIDAGISTNKKAWLAIQLNSELKLQTNATIVIKYRTDYASAWTTLKTLNASDANPTRNIPFGVSSTVIELRFEITSPASSNDSARIHGFSLEYMPYTQ